MWGFYGKIAQNQNIVFNNILLSTYINTQINSYALLHSHLVSVFCCGSFFTSVRSPNVSCDEDICWRQSVIKKTAASWQLL